MKATEEEIAAFQEKYGQGLGVKLPPVIVPVVAVSVSVVLPLPPSSNNMFVNVPGRGRVPSAKYNQWKKQAAQALKNTGKVEAPVEVRIIIRPGKFWRRTSDLANREKAVTDALVTAGVIPEDNCLVVQKISVEYRPLPDPPKGVPPVAIVMVKHCEIGSQPIGTMEGDP
jgi:crossover junction endodeoxyribonuclease RusA